MLTVVDDKIVRRVIERIEDMIDQRKGQLVVGAFARSEDATAERIATEYMYRVGYLKALDDVLNAISSVGREASKR